MLRISSRCRREWRSATTSLVGTSWLGRCWASVLLVVSLVGYVAGSFIEQSYIGLLGFIPLLIGLYKLWQLIREACWPQNDPASSPPVVGTPAPLTATPPVIPPLSEPTSLPSVDDSPASTRVNVGGGVVRFHAQDGTVRTLYYDPPQPAAAVVDVKSPVTDTPPAWTAFILLYLGYVINRNTLKVASVTMANGADNVGVYIPLFASSSSQQIAVIIVVFFVLVAIWLGGSYLLLYFPPLAKGIARYGDYLVPIALIGLGLYIFYDTDVLSIV